MSVLEALWAILSCPVPMLHGGDSLSHPSSRKTKSSPGSISGHNVVLKPSAAKSTSVLLTSPHVPLAPWVWRQELQKQAPPPPHRCRQCCYSHWTSLRALQRQRLTPWVEVVHQQHSLRPPAPPDSRIRHLNVAAPSQQARTLPSETAGLTRDGV